MFLLKLCKKAIFSIPNSIKQHYSPQILRTFRLLERLKRKHVKRLCDIQFLKTCLCYNLSPKIVQFKLYKSSKLSLKQSQSLKIKILRSEISDNFKSSKKISQMIERTETSLWSSLSYFHRIKVQAFLYQSVTNAQKGFGITHDRKLKDLGLHVGDPFNPQAVYNSTNHVFTDE